jgi:hypothetical protein
MASASITLKTKADANVVYTLVGQTANGASYKDATRSLALPRTLDFQFVLGNPGSLGNDKIIVILKDSAENAATGLVKTLQLKIEVSVPRDAAITTTMVEDILCQLQALSVDANAEYLADAIVP